METGKRGHETISDNAQARGKQEEKKHAHEGEGKTKDKHDEKKASTIPIVVLFLLLFTAFYVYTIVIKPRTSVIAEDGYEYIKYKGEIIPLRATVGDCKSVPVEPSTKAVADSLKNTKRIVLLVDPYEEDKYYKVNLLAQIPLIARSKYLEKPISYAYTREYENSTAPLEPDILSLDFGNANHAAIQMGIGKETKINMERDGQILISANESKAYDKAVCALELSVLGVI